MDSDPIDSISDALEQFPSHSQEDFEKELANLEYMILAARETFVSSGLALRQDPETFQKYLDARLRYVQTPDVMRNTLHDMEKYLRATGKESNYVRTVIEILTYATTISRHQPFYPREAVEKIAPLTGERDKAEKTARAVFPQNDEQIDINNPDPVCMGAHKAALEAEDKLAETVEEAHKALSLRRKLRRLHDEIKTLQMP